MIGEDIVDGGGDMALYGIFRGISMFLQLVYDALLIYCILSWILPPYQKVMMFLAKIMDPLLRPVRNTLFRVFPRLPIDLSALVLFFVLRMVRSLLWRLYTLLS